MSNFNILMEHEASSSQAHQMNPEEQIESEINFWFDEDTWNQAEREISPDEVLAKEEEESLSYGKKMEYKSYLSTRRQHRESPAKMAKNTFEGDALDSWIPALKQRGATI
ncbi:hypothetical protein Tco_1225440 [Tanacetum coccineum]